MPEKGGPEVPGVPTNAGWLVILDRWKDLVRSRARHPRHPRGSFGDRPFPSGCEYRIPEDADLDVFPVDFCAVGAFQICQDELFVIFLDLNVITADPFVVQLDRISFLSSDRNGRRKTFKDTTPIGAVQQT